MANILLIEDDGALRGMLKEILEQHGHVVTEAGNGRQGVASYQKGVTDLVITDVIMPDKEGIETIMDLRKISPDVKIIAMSGGGRSSTADYLQIARSFGAKRVLYKPFDFSDLKVAVEETLAGIPPSGGQAR